MEGRKQTRFFYANEEAPQIVRNAAGKPLSALSTVRAYGSKAARDAYVDRGGPMRRAVPAAEVSAKKFDCIRCMACFCADYGAAEPEQSDCRYWTGNLGGEMDWTTHVKDCHTAEE